MSPSQETSSDYRTTLLSELVGINSVHPGQAGERSGPGGEGELANWLAERAVSLGADVVLDEVQPGRPNVYAFFATSGPGAERTVAVDVHLDTVGVEHMVGDPFDGRVADGRVYGRGSVDTKATLAVLLPLLEEVAANQVQLNANLLLVGTVGEEMGGLPGAHRFCTWLTETGLRPNAIVVAEPTMCAPVHGHKGGLGLEIVVHGHAAHSSKPELGANAIVGAAKIVSAFATEQQRLSTVEASTAMGPGTLSVCEIAGGRARNIIPDECRIYAGRRIVPGEDPDAIYVELCEMARAAAEPLDLTVVMANGRASAAFYEDSDAVLIQELAMLSGARPEVATYGSNALAYADACDGLVVFGPGSIDQAHQAVEWIDIGQLDRADRLYRQWLGAS